MFDEMRLDERLAHNAHVLVLTGPSYRARGRRQLEEVTLPPNLTN